MDTVTYPDPLVREELTRWLAERIDVSASTEVARAFAVVAVPEAVALAGDGRVLGRRAGFVEPADFATWLEELR